MFKLKIKQNIDECCNLEEPFEGVGGGDELPYEKDGLLILPFKGSKRQFWYLIECSASKGPQQELLQYLFGYRAQKI